MTLDVALYGPTGSGKSTVAEILVELGYQHLKSRRACRDICQLLFQSESKEILNDVTMALRRVDPHVWVMAALREGESRSRPVVFDSMRFATDYDFFRARGFKLVRIDTDPGTRYRRLALRGQEFDPLRDDNHLAEVELIRHSFDYVLTNNDDEEELRRQVLGLAGQLGISAQEVDEV